MLVGKIKCGTYWNNLPGHEERAFCSACRKMRGTQALESEQHLWMECENNGQTQAWEAAKNIWQRTTSRNWPDVSMGLIRGAAALTFDDDYSKDSERLEQQTYVETNPIRERY